MRNAIGRAASQVSPDGVDHLHFGFALDVEGEHALAQCVLDLVARLAHAGERAALRLAPGVQDAVKLARRDDVEPGSLVREEVQDGEIAVGLDGVADHVIQAIQRGVQAAKMVLDRPGAVDVEGGIVFGGEGGRGLPPRNGVGLYGNERSAWREKGVRAGTAGRQVKPGATAAQGAAFRLRLVGTGSPSRPKLSAFGPHAGS